MLFDLAAIDIGVRAGDQHRTAHGEIEAVGLHEDAVADDFGFDTTTLPAGEVFVFGIVFEEGGVGLRGLAIGRGVHHEAMHCLHGPTGFDEVLREVIEEFRVSGLLAEAAEVVGRGDDASSEMPTPKAVYNDAGGEWVFGGSNPAGELESSALFFGHRDFFATGPGRGDAARGFFAEGKIVATKMDFDVLCRVFRDAHDFVGIGEVFFERGDLFAQLFFFLLGRLLVLSLGFEFVDFGPGLFVSVIGEVVFVEFGDDGILREGLGRHEDAGKAVVFLDRDGVDFVIMATGAADGHAEEGAAHRVHLFVDDVAAHFVGVVAGEHLGSDGKETETDGLGAFLGEVFGGEKIAGELFDDEFVEGFVFVEGSDDVIAVAPGGRMGDVFVHAVGVGVAGDVEPVASPAFAVAGGFEEFVDEARPGFIPGVGEEGVDLLGGGREAVEIEVGAPDEGEFFGGLGGEVAALLDSGQDEVIEVFACPAGVFDRGEGGVFHGTIGPVVLGSKKEADGESEAREYPAKHHWDNYRNLHADLSVEYRRAEAP